MAQKRASRRKSAPRRHRGIGFLFWVCLVGIIVAVGFAARGSIKDSLSRLSGARSSGQGTSQPAPGGAPGTGPRVTIAPLPDSGHPANPAPGRPPSGATGSAPAAPAGAAPAGSPGTAPATAPMAAQPRAPAGTPDSPPAAVRPTVRKSRLFFVTVDPAGRLLMKSVIRPIPASDSPLRDTLEALLKGPTAQELNSGMLSMIPMEAKLRAVTVSGETAVVDFNESFRFNAQGIDALNAQLRQVVYAATEFPSVKEVQVLIEGKKVRSLGTEGVRIDAPLSRSSFSP
jgi:germination protein M